MTDCLVPEELLYDSQNRFATNAIFWETNNKKTREKYPPSYTLKLRDYAPEGFDTLPSAYKVYMEAIDEYDAAIKLVGNMANWNQLCGLDWFMSGGKFPAQAHIGLKAWREHKAAKVKSEAMAVLKEKVQEKDTTAAKAVLAEIKDEAKGATKKKAGRPNTQNNTSSLGKEAENFLKRVK